MAKSKGKVTVTVNLTAMKNRLLTLAKIVDGPTKDLLGKFVDVSTKERVARGLSPVRGVGRFPAYAVQRKTAQARHIKKSLSGSRRKSINSKISNAKDSLYPRTVKDKFPDKKDRPINLYLDGTFLSNIGYNWTKLGIEYGLQSDRKLMVDMFQTHNNGTHKDVPQRKFVPVNPKDKYVKAITLGIKEIYSDRIKDIIKRMNRNRKG